MAPREDIFVPIQPRRKKFGISAEEYIEMRQREDGAHGLWRVYDRIYDLSEFAKSHPGGTHWINLTKGLDITEHFECHHINETAERVLAKFSWKPATAPRMSTYTFKEDGFFKRAKKKAAEALAKAPDRGATWGTTLVCDTLATGAALTAIDAALTGSFLSAWMSGIAIGLLYTSSHNFTHLRPNWRQYYIVVALLSMKDWRTSHILSHHPFPNTNLDMEVLHHEPIIDFYPRADKGRIKSYLQCLMFPLYAALMWPVGAFSRLIEMRGELCDLLNLSPLAVLIATSILAGQGIKGVLFDFVLFSVIMISQSLIANVIGYTVAHHHPDIYHHGDEPREDRDWGLAQLDAIRDRADSKTDFILSALTFGDHSAHHLFPTLDHGRLPLVRHAIDSTLDEMGLKRLEKDWPNLIVGMFQTILRHKGHPVTCRNLSKDHQ